MAYTQPRKRGTQLPRLWIDPSPFSFGRPLQTPASALSSARASGSTTSSAGPHTADAFHALCLYDFTSEDPDQLSFRKNEILDIIKRENTGWWAALHPRENRIGWIPSTFVEAISEHMANKLIEYHRGTQTHEHIKKAYTPPAIVKSGQPFITSPEKEAEGQDWVPLLDDEQAPVMQLFRKPAKDVVTFAFSPLAPPHEGIDSHPLEFHDSDSDFCSPIDSTMSRLMPIPASPTPMPPETPHTGVSPAPAKAAAPPHKHTLSSPTAGRHSRPRPLLIDDCRSLSRLSTLFETKNVEELASPQITDMFDSFARAAKVIRSDKEPEEIQLREDGTVTADSLCRLLDKLIDDTASAQHVKFQHVFLMTFRTFTTADELFNFLSKQFYVVAPPYMTHEELNQWEKENVQPMRTRILAILEMWSGEYGMYQYDRHVVPRVVNLLSPITTPPPLVSTAGTVLQSLIMSRALASHGGVAVSVLSSKRSVKQWSKGDLLRMDPAVLGQHLSMYKHRLYTRICPQQCLNWARTRDDIADLVTFCNTHDQLTAWVQSSILSADGTEDKVNTVDFWIQVAESCMLLNNFSGVHALVTAFSSNCIAQLQQVWTKARLDALSNLRHTSGHTLERALDGPCVPHIQSRLMEIVHTNEQYEDCTDVSIPSTDATISLINFAKREKWFDIVQATLRHQSRSYGFYEDVAMTEFIVMHLEIAAWTAQCVSPGSSGLDLACIRTIY